MELDCGGSFRSLLFIIHTTIPIFEFAYAHAPMHAALTQSAVSGVRHKDRVMRCCFKCTAYLLIQLAALASCEVHHQRPLPSLSLIGGASDAISLHANSSPASFAVGDHLVSWLRQHPEQHVVHNRRNIVKAEDVVFVGELKLNLGLNESRAR